MKTMCFGSLQPSKEGSIVLVVVAVLIVVCAGAIFIVEEDDDGWPARRGAQLRRILRSK